MKEEQFISFFSKLGDFICKYRGIPFFEKLSNGIRALDSQIDNVNFNHHTNGELRVLNKINKINPNCIFDVGANKGDWTKLMKSIYPACLIHAFEIVPSTFGVLQESIKGLQNVTLNNFGLSDKTDNITIYYNTNERTTATANKINGMHAHNVFYDNKIQCNTKKALEYINENKIGTIDFVKIDVEGMDFKVIKGFDDKINQVRIFQFEYGIFNIASHDLLSDFCAYLTDHGFIIGKIFPKFVNFFQYYFDRENFHGGNYLAIKKEEGELINFLAKYSD